MQIAVKLVRMNEMISGEWNERSGCHNLQYHTWDGFLQLIKFSLQPPSKFLKQP